MAIDNGNINSIDSLADIHYFGNVITKDVDEAKRLYNVGIKYGNVQSMIKLAKIYCEENNIVEAVRLYKMAIDYGNDVAMNNLAYMYSVGYNVDKNLDEAIRLLELSIGKGNEQALINLAHIYQTEQEVKDNNLALKYYIKYCEKTRETIGKYFMLDSYDIFWEDYLHKYWPNREILDKQIITLLLISKNRVNNDNDWMVKGVAKLIIRYLATFEKNTYCENKILEDELVSDYDDTGDYDDSDEVVSVD